MDIGTCQLTKDEGRRIGEEPPDETRLLLGMEMCAVR